MGVKDAKCENRHLSVCVLVVLSCFPSLGPQCCGVYVLDLCVWARFKKAKKQQYVAKSMCVDIWCRIGGGEEAVFLPLICKRADLHR